MANNIKVLGRKFESVLLGWKATLVITMAMGLGGEAGRKI